MNRVKALGCLLVLMVGVLLACSELKSEPIGDRIHAPFDIARVAKWNDFVVLNSSFDVRYDEGSIQRIGLTTGGDVVKKQTLTVPRLGTRLALSDDESHLAVAFSGAEGGIRIYSVTESLGSEPTTFLPLSDDLVITDVDWIRLGTGAGARELLAVEQGGNNRAGRVRVYEFAQGSIKPLFSIPDDLPGARNPVYELGSSSAVFIPGSNLLAFFPSDGLGRLGTRPSPYEIFKSRAWSGDSDPRGVSIVAVDLEAYFASGDLELSSGYVPLALTDAMQMGDLDLEPNDTANSSLSFRTQFTEAALAKGAGCSSVAGGAADDLVLAGLYGNGHVVGISGWAALRTGLQGLAQDRTPAKRLVFGSLSLSPYSLGDGAAGLPSGLYRVTQVRSVPLDQSGACLPLILRAEVKIADGLLTNAGRETVWLANSLGRAPGSPNVSRIPERSSVRFAGEPGGLFFVSFSQDAIVPALLGGEGTVTFGNIFRERK